MIRKNERRLGKNYFDITDLTTLLIDLKCRVHHTYVASGVDHHTDMYIDECKIYSSNHWYGIAGIPVEDAIALLPPDCRLRLNCSVPMVQ